MKWRRVILVLVGLLMAVLVAIFIWPGEREPEYQGKKLSEWARTRTDNPDHRELVRHFGTNALPWLVKWLGYDPPPPWQINVLKIVAKFPRRLGGNYARQELYGFERLNRSNFAHLSFSALGRDARPAIPDLVMLANDPTRPKGAQAAVTILANFGTEAVPSFLTILRNEQAPGRRGAIVYFQRVSAGDLGTNANAAAETLVLRLSDADSRVRSEAALALANLALQPEVVIPALAKSAGDSVALVRSSSLQALAAFGELARPVVPAILRGLRDPDEEVRALARFALDQIAPEVLEAANADGATPKSEGQNH